MRLRRNCRSSGKRKLPPNGRALGRRKGRQVRSPVPPSATGIEEPQSEGLGQPRAPGGRVGPAALPPDGVTIASRTARPIRPPSERSESPRDPQPPPPSCRENGAHEPNSLPGNQKDRPPSLATKWRLPLGPRTRHNTLVGRVEWLGTGGSPSHSDTEALRLPSAPATPARDGRPGCDDARTVGVVGGAFLPVTTFGPIESKSLPVSDVMTAQWRPGAGSRIAMRVAGPGGRAAVSCPGAWWSDEGIVGKFSRRFVYKCVFTQCALFSARPPPSARRRGPTRAPALPPALLPPGLRPGRAHGRLRSAAWAKAEFINNPRPPLWGGGARLAEDATSPPSRRATPAPLRGPLRGGRARGEGGALGSRAA